MCFSMVFIVFLFSLIFNIDWKRHLTCYCMKINAKGTIVKGHIFQGNRVDSAVSIPWRGDTGQVATAAKSWEGGGSSPVSGWHKAYVPLICTLKQTAPKILQSVSKRERERERESERERVCVWENKQTLVTSGGISRFLARSRVWRRDWRNCRWGWSATNWQAFPTKKESKDRMWT